MPNEMNTKYAKQLASSSYPMDIVYDYPNLQFDNNNDKRLILLDLRADGEFQDLVDAEALADDFMEKQLPNSIKIIDLYISDLPAEVGLAEFGEKLANTFMQKYQREIYVRIITNIKHDCTLLVPPEDQLWKVYGLKNFANCPVMSLNTLTTVSTKTLLWEGKDLKEWLNNPKRICMAKEVEKRYMLSNYRTGTLENKLNAFLEVSQHPIILNDRDEKDIIVSSKEQKKRAQKRIADDSDNEETHSRKRRGTTRPHPFFAQTSGKNKINSPDSDSDEEQSLNQSSSSSPGSS